MGKWVLLVKYQKKMFLEMKNIFSVLPMTEELNIDLVGLMRIMLNIYIPPYYFSMEEYKPERIYTMAVLLNLEWKKMRRFYICCFITAVIYSCMIIVPFISGYKYYYQIDIWQESCGFLPLIFPIFAVIPTCWMMYYERRNKFIQNVLSRVSLKKYILSKWIITVLLSFVIVFTVSFVGLLFALLISKNMVFQEHTEGINRSLKQFAGYYYVNKPLVYGFVLSLWRGFLGGLMATMGFVLSLYKKNIFAILIPPFAYGLLENYLVSTIFNAPQFRLITSFSPNTYSYEYLSVPVLLVSPTILIIVILSIWLYSSRIQKSSICEL